METSNSKSLSRLTKLLTRLLIRFVQPVQNASSHANKQTGLARKEETWTVDHQSLRISTPIPAMRILNSKQGSAARGS